MEPVTRGCRDSPTSRKKDTDMDLKLELIVLPVSDVDRAKAFYEKAGFRLDLDVDASEDWRAVHFTPPGSECSIIFGKGLTTAALGSFQGLYLVVSDIEEARAELTGLGIEVSEVFHDAHGVLYHGHDAGDVTHRLQGQERLAGPHPERATYCSYATFSDPDGNGWVLQEITQRFPGR
jgi:catechol 2,3-dioxygenase-like lactoylglutathione lyase family enzyme